MGASRSRRVDRQRTGWRRAYCPCGGRAIGSSASAGLAKAPSLRDTSIPGAGDPGGADPGASSRKSREGSVPASRRREVGLAGSPADVLLSCTAVARRRSSETLLERERYELSARSGGGILSYEVWGVEG